MLEESVFVSFFVRILIKGKQRKLLYIFTLFVDGVSITIMK